MRSCVFVIVFLLTSATNCFSNNFIFSTPSLTDLNSSCEYGDTTCYAGNYHTGQDYDDGGAAISINTGKIVGIEHLNADDHGMGNNVIVEYILLSSGSRVYGCYSHLDSIASHLYLGKIVRKNEELGVIGASGYGSGTYWTDVGGGAHLHFEMKIAATSGSPIGSYWGYTTNHPDQYGYLDPNEYIGSQRVILPSNSVLKFANHPDVYLVQKNQLWPISSERAYALLGYNTGNCTTADWGRLIELPECELSYYQHLIRPEVISSQNLMVKIADQVGPNTCRARDADRYVNTAYIFDCGQFRPIYNWDVCEDMDVSDSDIVEVTQDLFDDYQCGWMVYNPYQIHCQPLLGGDGSSDDMSDCFLTAPQLSGQAVSDSAIRLDVYLADYEVCTNYNIRIWQNGSVIGIYPASGFDSSSTINGLTANTQYCFEVAAVVIEDGQETQFAKSNTVCKTTLYADSDGDGVTDDEDDCPADPDKIVPGQCGCGTPDTDSDGDGVADCQDDCPDDPDKVDAGICGCGSTDLDSDNDNIYDCEDGCPNDYDKIEPGDCGCGASDIDSDLDGIADCNDGCPLDGSKTSPGICGCGALDTDSDGDGIVDCEDAYPYDPLYQTGLPAPRNLNVQGVY